MNSFVHLLFHILLSMFIKKCFGMSNKQRDILNTSVNLIQD